MTRRELLLAAAFVPAWCRAGEPQSHTDGRLHARPAKEPSEAIEPGLHTLDLDGDRDTLLYLPESYQPDRPVPLAVMLHGAGGEARISDTIRQIADEFSLIILAPSSGRETWDVVRGRLGPDVAMIDEVLARTFARCRIDPRRVAIGGFSDGASYALTLGTLNGDLFTHILAFSPGFIAAKGARGRPRIFISHGRRDQVLDIGRSSRRIVPELQDAGYEVRYREFDGPHTVPEAVAREAFTWFAK